ncbi:hypothetical protein PS2_028774 [Malus domestica]
MQKAYDRVEWDFLDAIMDRMGFCSMWRQLIICCVSSVRMTVILKGQPGQQFTPSRGLRQGDPLSPYLFLLVGEVLSSMIQDAVHVKKLDGVKIGASGPIISHMFFADDILLFLRADKKNSRNLVDLLRKYCDASGQKVNLQKSSVYFGTNIHTRIVAELANVLGIPVVDNPGAYLGVPAIWGRSKKRGLAYIKGRILGKLQRWKQNILSRAGKEVLIKAVVQAILAYPMSIFNFPAIVCQDLDVLVAGFWWGSLGPKKKTHWVSKTVLGLPKDMGGLGFWSFSEFNDALLAKQWREVIRNGSHWQIIGGENVRVWAFISDEEQTTIRQIPIGDLRRNDRLVWNARKNGHFSVKSGYHWLQTRSLASQDQRLQRELAPPLPITRHVHVQGWLPHSSPCYKINVDASWSKVPQSGFVSMVIRDAGGRFVAAARYAILSLNVATAEVVALLHGGGLGSSLGCNSIIIESDSRESIDCLSRDFDSGS